MKRAWIVAAAVVVGLGVTGQRASALDIECIEIVCGSERTDGTITDWFFEIAVEGTGLVNGVFWNQHLSGSGMEWKAFTLDGNELLYRETFPSQAAMEAKYPNANGYHLYINYLGPNPLDFQDQVLLGFAALPPTGFATISDPLHGATGVAPDPLYKWNDVSGVCNALGLVVNDGVRDEVYALIPELDETRREWQPGPLAPNSPYSISVATANLTAGDNQILNMLSGDPFEAIRGYVDINTNSFRTGTGAVPEPGTWAIVGTAFIAFLGWRRRVRMD